MKGNRTDRINAEIQRAISNIISNARTNEFKMPAFKSSPPTTFFSSSSDNSFMLITL